jgi:regulator of protease activity HflC (stomatin/prohibitin superfamily)
MRWEDLDQGAPPTMTVLGTIAIVLVILVLIAAVLTLKIVKQYEQGVVFRLGRVIGAREPGLRLIIPVIDSMHRASSPATTSAWMSRRSPTSGSWTP